MGSQRTEETEKQNKYVNIVPWAWKRYSDALIGIAGVYEKG
jgi:hypothetical protein